jgi:hypothetical protein
MKLWNLSLRGVVVLACAGVLAVAANAQFR